MADIYKELKRMLPDAFAVQPRPLTDEERRAADLINRTEDIGAFVSSPTTMTNLLEWEFPGHADYDHYIGSCELCQAYVVAQIIERYERR